MIVSRRFRLLFLLVFIVPATGCLFRARKVERPVINAPLKVATQADLIRAVNEQAAKIQTLQATVDIDSSVGGANKGKVTDYQQIRGYVLLRKPAMLRMIGLVPVVRNRAFDMVSDGKIFKVWIPSKNRFVIGRNDLPSTNSNSTLEKLRPQQIYDAMILREIDPENEIAVMEKSTELVKDTKGHQLEQGDYELNVIRKGGQGWFLSRKIIFSRTDLLPHRQLIYDENGNLATNSRYDGYKDQNGIMFPWQVEIVRPQEEYDITLTLIKLQVNDPLADDKFALEQPPGAEAVHLDEERPGPQPAAHLHSR